MPKRTDINRILVIGSGPIVIGQAAEFDYAGTQACLALREEGYEVILCNSNPATIMTDTSIADKVYMEPLTLEYLARIIRYERPDALLPGIGGQTGLNLAMKLDRAGVLAECRVELLGTKASSIERAESREEFKRLCEELGEPVMPSATVASLEAATEAAEGIGYPVVLRPAFTLGGTGGGFAADREELAVMIKSALELSPVHQVLIEKSVKGYKEIEYEVMRDSNDTAVTVCNMENIDPVGIHTGDSIVVCPSQTLSNKDYQMLRDSALRIIRALEIEGGCNVQFALDPESSQYYLIEVNPRVSRSSALASKASGYPIARVSAKIGVGLTLDEIPLANTPASFEPALDYIVTKLPRFPFDKFADASNVLSTQMKATGEIMSVGRSFEESLLKGIRSLETGSGHLHMDRFDSFDTGELLTYTEEGRDDRIFALAELIRRGADIEHIHEMTAIDRLFLMGLQNIVRMEEAMTEHPLDMGLLREAKRMGFSDRAAASLWNTDEETVFRLRCDNGIMPVYKMIDTCASEFDSYVPYFYSTYEDENESVVSERRKVIVVGSGPIRIGQGIEFDYSTVHAVNTIKAAGYEAIIINNNPETVSTDYTCSDKLYFEPLTIEDVMNIIMLEQPEGVIATLGGQTAINLAEPLSRHGVRLMGTDCEAICMAEDRESFEAVLEELGIPQPDGRAVTGVEAGLEAAEEIGYPVLVRPSFVLGGRAMQIVADRDSMVSYLRTAVQIDEDRPVLVDKYIRGREVEIDAVCDGRNIFIPGIMEMVERTGVHSGDSISIYPPLNLSEEVKETIIEYSEKLALRIGIKGLFNIQFIVDESGSVYIIELNPRSSRSVPFISKSTGYSLADIGTHVMLGLSLKEQGIFDRYPPEKSRSYVKAPAFSFSKLHGMDACLSPEMKSTGEAIGYDDKIHRALYKAMTASGMRLKNYGTVLASIADEDKDEAVPLIRRFYEMGFNIVATEYTGRLFKRNGIRTHILRKPSEGSTDITSAVRSGYVSYVINTRTMLTGRHSGDGMILRQCASDNNVTMLTSLDTVRILLDVLEEMSIGISVIDSGT